MVGVTHSVTTAEPNNPAYDVSATAWNADHLIAAASIPIEKIQYLEETASYVVWLDGGTYYAKHGHSGAITSNAVFATLLNATIAACSGGEILFVRDGSYVLAASITDQGKNNITIHGESMYGTIFELQGNYEGIYLTGQTGWLLENFTLDGNDNQTGSHPLIELEDMTYSDIRRVYAHHCKGNLSGGSYGFYITNATYCNLIECRAENCDHGGMIITSDSSPTAHCKIIRCYGYDNADSAAFAQSSHFVIYGTDATNNSTDCHIIDCVGITSGNQGAQIYRYCYDCSVVGSYFEDFDNNGINLCHGSFANTCRSIKADNCMIVQSGARLHTAVGIESYQDHAEIVNCTIEHCNVGIVLNSDSKYQSVLGGTVYSCNSYNILASGDYSIIEGVHIRDSHIWVHDAGAHTYHCRIEGCLFEGANYGVDVGSTDDFCQIINNTFKMAVAWGYCVNVTASAEDTVIQGNDFDPAVTTPITNAGTRTVIKNNENLIALTDTGTNTILDKILIPFIKEIGTAAWVSTTYNGIDVDAANEGALTFGHIPMNHRLFRIKIWGINQVDPGAANAMMLTVNAEGSKVGEAYNSEAITISKYNNQDDQDVGDRICWVLTASDDADLDDIMADEGIQLKALYSAASGSDIATDACLQYVEFEYI